MRSKFTKLNLNCQKKGKEIV